MKQIPEVTLVSMTAGTDDSGGFSSLFGESGTHVISFTFKLLAVEDRNKSSEEVAEEIRQIIAPMPEVINFSVLSETGGMGAMGGETPLTLKYTVMTSPRPIFLPNSWQKGSGRSPGRPR
jgi:hypothetical protein